MAKKPTNKKGDSKKPADPKYVTEERFSKLEQGVDMLIELMQKERSAPAATADSPVVAVDPVIPAVETPLEKEVRKAGSDQVQRVPTDWEEKALEIVGDALDHCEMTYGQNGGVRFIVVIKKEKSNAAKDYLAFYGQDRRTKDIAGEGIAGVENWCKLIRQNLNRPNIN
jgi:hypothetical protein